MVWDGDCGFCRYWILYWKSRTGERVLYAPYQEVAASIPEIPAEEFRKASRFIETDGRIYSGPASAYKSVSYFENSPDWPVRWYLEGGIFRKLSDGIYMHIARNRGFYMKVTRLLFGKNPGKLKYYWIWYILVFLLLIVILI